MTGIFNIIIIIIIIIIIVYLQLCTWNELRT